MARTPSKGLTFEKLRELARAGAEDAPTPRSEIGAIERTFPELATGDLTRLVDANVLSPEADMLQSTYRRMWGDAESSPRTW